MTTENLLIEIGTEELPPKTLKNLAQAFADNFADELQKANLSFTEIKWYATPRRLALKVKNVLTKQANQTLEKKGPPVKQAFDANNHPTNALIGWLKGCGISQEQAQIISTDKGDWFVHKVVVEGKHIKDLLINQIKDSLKKLPITKSMRWGNNTESFIRPVHTITILLGEQLIEGDIFGISSDRIIQGHRFIGESTISLDSEKQYPQVLAEVGLVIADFAERKAFIKSSAIKAANLIGGIVDLDEDLLDEVTALVEYPVVLTAKFEERFLAVPPEALVYTMKGDQKYFPIYDKENKLLPNFIFVANINPEDPSYIIQGNEKVVRPRLKDAEFFFKTDLKTKLEDLLPKLDTVLFQKELGSLLDKTKRIETLSGIIAEQIGANITSSKRAALLSKCDLMTNMVFEFTETQGIMGMHYARHNGEAEEVAVALKEQYMPRFAGDELPSSLVSCSVSIADKIDTVVGIFGIGQAPKSDKDPFALRRSALGILRIIIEKNLNLDLATLLQTSINLYSEKITNKNTLDDVITFILSRCPAFYQSQHYTTDVIQSVLSLKPTKPADFDAKIKAVHNFKSLPVAEMLAKSNKRVSNILAKNNEILNAASDLQLAEKDAEKVLITKVQAMQLELAPIIKQQNYDEVLQKLSSLSDDIDNFFEVVMINVDEKEKRINRLTLLNEIRCLFLDVADISLLQ